MAAGFDAPSADLVAGAMRDADPAVRARAHGAAHRLGTRRVADRVRALGDESTLVRLRGCELEARYPSPSVRVRAALVGLLGDDEPLVVVAALGALGEIGSESCVAAISSVAAAHPDARCREAAVAALGSLGEPAGLDAVLGALSDKPAIRRRATVALAAFEGPRVESALAASLEDRDWQVRQAAEALRPSGRS